MAGILDSKQRVMDVIITDEGREQAASGELSIRYATFTDRHTFYATDTPLDRDAVANDASGRIFFECTSRHQDQIVVETLDNGTTKAFAAGDFDLTNQNFVSGLSPEGAPSDSLVVYSGSNFTENADTILDDITQNFHEQQILGTIDPFSDTTNFTLSNSSLKFQITNNSPIDLTRPDAIREMSLENIESLFQDRRLSHLPNFLYLPPDNLPKTGERYGRKLGNYVNWNQKPHESLQDLLKDLENKEWQEIEFTETSRENNLVIQPFEFSDVGVKKLVIIDHGEYPDDDPFSPGKRVFFVGKLYKDKYGSSTYVNIFTVIMD